MGQAQSQSSGSGCDECFGAGGGSGGSGGSDNGYTHGKVNEIRQYAFSFLIEEIWF